MGKIKYNGHPIWAYVHTLRDAQMRMLFVEAPPICRPIYAAPPGLVMRVPAAGPAVESDSVCNLLQPIAPNDHRPPGAESKLT